MQRIRYAIFGVCASTSLGLTVLSDQALKLYTKIVALKQPNRRALKGARRAFRVDPDTNMIIDKMETHLDDEKDLCVLATGDESDRLTKLFEGQFAFLFRVSDPSLQPSRHLTISYRGKRTDLITATSFFTGMSA